MLISATRELATDTSKYCLPDACFNPHVLAVETGYDVTTFLGAKPKTRARLSRAPC